MYFAAITSNSSNPPLLLRLNKNGRHFRLQAPSSHNTA